MNPIPSFVLPCILHIPSLINLSCTVIVWGISQRLVGYNVEGSKKKAHRKKAHRKKAH